MALQAAFPASEAPSEDCFHWLDGDVGPRTEARGLVALVRTDAESVESVREPSSTPRRASPLAVIAVRLLEAVKLVQSRALKPAWQRSADQRASLVWPCRALILSCVALLRVFVGFPTAQGVPRIGTEQPDARSRGRPQRTQLAGGYEKVVPDSVTQFLLQSSPPRICPDQKLVFGFAPVLFTRV